MPLRRYRLLQVRVELVEELVGGQPRVIGADQDCQIARHVAGFDGVDTDLLQILRKADDISSVVEGAVIAQPARPREDRGDRVGRGLPALLMLAIVAGDRTVSSLGLYRLAVRRQLY